MDIGSSRRWFNGRFEWRRYWNIWRPGCIWLHRKRGKPREDVALWDHLQRRYINGIRICPFLYRNKITNALPHLASFCDS